MADDELNVCATLKGPLFAIGDEELVEYRQRFGRLHPYRLPREVGVAVGVNLNPIVDALTLLRSLHGLCNYRAVEETVNRLLIATRAYATFVLSPWGEQALQRVARRRAGAHVRGRRRHLLPRLRRGIERGRGHHEDEHGWTVFDFKTDADWPPISGGIAARWCCMRRWSRVRRRGT